MPKLSDVCFQNSSTSTKNYSASWLILLVGLTGWAQTISAAESANVEEVLVTGSRIQGVPPVGAKVTTIEVRPVKRPNLATLIVTD